MKNITEENPQKMLLAKPKIASNENMRKQPNIFASMRATQPLPKLSKIIGKQYDVVGPKKFKQKILQTKRQDNREREPVQQMNETGFRSSMMNSTINRQTMMTKMTKEQTNLIQKDCKHMNRYKEMQQQWERDSIKLHKLSHRKPNEKTLLQENVKDLYVHPNHDKIAVLNDFVVHFWQMSLRNNHHILERHIRGHRFNRVQLEELLQLDNGIKKVERSIPKLPLSSLKNIQKRNLSLTGRNKAMSETEGTGFVSARMSSINPPNQQQVFKVNYDGPLKWMSNEGL